MARFFIERLRGAKREFSPWYIPAYAGAILGAVVTFPFHGNVIYTNSGAVVGALVLLPLSASYFALFTRRVKTSSAIFYGLLGPVIIWFLTGVIGAVFFG
jgi:hypothetical protein